MYQREVVLYSRRRSLRCWRAKRLLRHSGYDFVVVDTTSDVKALAELSNLAHHKVVAPYVVVDHRPVGNFGVVKALIRTGGLERVVRGEL
jgi:glutaredoxin